MYTYYVFIYTVYIYISDNLTFNSIFSLNMTVCEVPVVHCRSMTCVALKVSDRWNVNTSNEKHPACLGMWGL